MIDFKKMEDKLNALKAFHKLSGKRAIISQMSEGSVEAFIDISDFGIQIKLNPTWAPDGISGRVKKLISTRQIANPVQKVVEDVSLHEIGHAKLENGRGCPKDLDGTDICLDAVAGVLKKKGKYSEGNARYLDNAILDILDNLNVHNYSSNDGLVMFFAEQGKKAFKKLRDSPEFQGLSREQKRQKEMQNRHYSPLYDAFVKMNLYLWGNKIQKSVLNKYYVPLTAKGMQNNAVQSQSKVENPDAKKVKTAVQNIISRLGIEKERENNKAFELLLEKGNWKKVFTVMAEELSELMEKD